MGRKKKQPQAQEVSLPQTQLSEEDDLRVFAAEAEQVGLMAKHLGWQILSRDLSSARMKIGERLAYLNPKTALFEDSRIEYIAIDKILKMVDDYELNRAKTLELLERLDNPRENIALDVDNNATG